MTRLRSRAMPLLLRSGCCLVAALVVAGCASTSVRDCRDIAGAGWQVLSQPPANAAQLLALQGIAEGGHTVWLGKGRHKVFACRYKSGLIYPGCSASRGYVFEQRPQGWVSNGVVLGTCDITKVGD